MPTVTVRRLVAATPEVVWAVIADIENAGRWNEAWQSIRFLGRKRQGLGTAFRAKDEDGRLAEFEVIAWQPPEYVAFAPRGESPGGDYLITLEAHAFHLQPLGDTATRLALMARARTHGLRGWLLGRLLWPGYQKPGMRRAVDAIAALVEPKPE